jgi:hypothetical protein
MSNTEELKQAAIDHLKMCQDTSDYEGDYEAAHSQADDILCKLLTDLGFADVVAEFDKVGKWYA